MSTSSSRVPAGVTTGGQFATSARREAAGVSLSATTGDGDALLRERMSSAAARVEQQRAVGVDPGDTEAATLRLVAVAAAVRLAHPSATSFTLEDSDQPDSTAMDISSVYDRDGIDLTGDDMYGVLGEDEDLAYDMLYDASSCIPHTARVDVRADATLAQGSTVPGLDLTGNERSGRGATIRIDELLAGTTDRQRPEPGAAGAQTIAAFAALHGDTDADELGSARDLLTELHHWARANGHDLQALVSAAGEVADEEAALHTTEENPA